MNRIKRLNIINSITGIKPANLIATKSKEYGTNLAIFSSVVHLGSNPPYIGFITRPIDEVPRHTYQNIQENGCYTINHVHQDFIEQAHYTSAKIETGVSEFDICGFTEEYLFDFPVPFVAESKIKMAIKLEEIIPIKINGTIMVIGSIEHLILPDSLVNEKGYINLEEAQNVGIAGLNGYYALQKIGEFPYARPNEVPDFKVVK